MSKVERSSDLQERYGAVLLTCAILGGIAFVIGLLMVIYNSMFFVLAWMLLVGGLLAEITALMMLLKIRQTGQSSVPVICPFCDYRNLLLAAPTADFTCQSCARSVPIDDYGDVMPVEQVRCSYCNALNFYSAKSVGLLCEECGREIPLAVSDEVAAHSTTRSYAFVEDHESYRLILQTGGTKEEEMIPCLQQMLALNRNQVKDLLSEAPTILLEGIPKKKAELLSAQIAVHGGSASYEVIR